MPTPVLPRRDGNHSFRTIQNESSRSLISQSFLPKSDPNRCFQRTLGNKSFFAACDPTRTKRALARGALKVARMAARADLSG
jgi:hypothetical protein